MQQLLLSLHLYHCHCVVVVNPFLYTMHGYYVFFNVQFLFVSIISKATFTLKKNLVLMSYHYALLIIQQKTHIIME